MNVTITTHEASTRYGIARGTLANLRCTKRGPSYVKIGRKVLYRVDEFEKWLFTNNVKTIDSIKE